MRFLQIEWHSHERARNAWDIERAEMLAKIVKQEGEVRQTKRINEQLHRQVRMLEMALKNERGKKGLNGTAAAPEGNASEPEPQDSKREDIKSGEENAKCAPPALLMDRIGRADILTCRYSCLRRQ